MKRKSIKPGDIVKIQGYADNLFEIREFRNGTLWPADLETGLICRWAYIEDAVFPTAEELSRIKWALSLKKNYIDRVLTLVEKQLQSKMYQPTQQKD